jgi:hypothetical protein
MESARKLCHGLLACMYLCSYPDMEVNPQTRKGGWVVRSGESGHLGSMPMQGWRGEVLIAASWLDRLSLPNPLHCNGAVKCRGMVIGIPRYGSLLPKA